MAAGDLKAKVSGVLEIKTIHIPLNASLPPDAKKGLEFSHEETKPYKEGTTTTIPVGDFINWGTNAVGMTTKAADLPGDLGKLQIAIDTLQVQTKTGYFHLKVQVGKWGTTAGKPWIAEFTPVNALSSLKLSTVSLELEKGTKAT